ncbi:MAG: DUF3486 family protein [Deltaproteobacteria bacterium]|nr:DUF3486 family protein [Deltaproteobacteria bacterium]MCL4873111.1 DUF3486 family protein [bacterium]
MPKRSAVKGLPPEVKAWLDQALVKSNFSDYKALEEMLKEKGFSISKSSIHRYGREFESKLAAIKLATEQARAVVEEVGDEENALGDALAQVVQQKAFEALMKLEDPGKVNLASIGKMVADLNRSSVTLKKYRAEVRGKVTEAAEQVAKEIKSKGLSEEAAEEIRQKILGIA